MRFVLICCCFALLIIGITSEKSAPEAADQSLDRPQGCTEGDVKHDDCNTCRCVNGGVWACSKMHCVHKRSEEKCNEGDQKQEDCNSCHCLKNGSWACTKRGCLHKRSNDDNNTNNTNNSNNNNNIFSCSPGQTFKKDCNNCTCTPDGKNAICTLQACINNADEN